MIILGGSIGVWLFYVQHQFEGAEWDHNERSDVTSAAIHGSSYYKLPKILQWLTANIGYHHVHHANPRIPNYFLSKCHEIDPAYNVVKPLKFFESFKTIRLKLWDEAQKKLIRYKDLKSV